MFARKEAERAARLQANLAKVRRRKEGWKKRALEAEAKLSEEPFDPSQILWIFATGRSGTTWLAQMLAGGARPGNAPEGLLEGAAHWGEPLVGELFGRFYYGTAAHKRGRMSICGDKFMDIFLEAARMMVLSGARARFPEARRVVIKEPHGSIGAPLMSEAMPESAILTMVRDPHDVVASALDAHKEGSWAREHLRAKTGKLSHPSMADTKPDTFVTGRARTYLEHVGAALEAYEHHKGPKTLIRYEDLRADTFSVLGKALSDVGVPIEDGRLRRVVKEHSFDALPEEEKGEGKFYRKATPGSWREELTPEQMRIIEDVCGNILKRFYPG